MELQQSRRLLRRVAARLAWVSCGRRAWWTLWILAAVYSALLLTSRLLGVIPDWFDGPHVLYLPLAALLVGFVVRRRVSAAEAARAVDEHAGSKDLFLTAAGLETAVGEFGSLVARDAETRAPKLAAAQVVPLVPGRRWAWVAGALALLWIGGEFLPQLDPFKRQEAVAVARERRDNLEKARETTLLRKAELKLDQEEGEQAKQVEQALDKLTQDYRKLKKNAKPQNMARLNENQKAVGEMWRKLSANKLGEMLKQRPGAQEFGGANLKKSKQWTEDLQAGKSDSLKKELEAIQDELKRLSKMEDPAKRAEQAQQVRKRMKDLSHFASESLNAKDLNASLERAISQLEAGELEKISDDALKDSMESLELSKLELEQLAQSANDLKSLEQALRTLQMAKRLSQEEKLDGEQCKECNGLEDYEKLFASLCKGEGGGLGMGGPGTGEGNVAPEDESTKTEFTPDRTPTTTQKGKVLLSLKSKGEGEKGQAKKEYRELVRQVRQGVSEAVLQEQIPPGYHEGIKKYFDSLDEAAKK